ncbi:hypothetical protein L3X38_000861 [Prunus dulcis]|uniref:Uncharacterized protein n=1 Tax=Prunus dulcis TaxID=3755 RepID=A0AAD4WSH0_PRUDU|nr:hypothetical protein L3X38_000861 [Prunus dulcis]
MGSNIFISEMQCKNAATHTLSSQIFAGSTWDMKIRHGCKKKEEERRRRELEEGKEKFIQGTRENRQPPKGNSVFLASWTRDVTGSNENPEEEEVPSKV